MAEDTLQRCGSSQQFKDLVQAFKRTRHEWMAWCYSTPEAERTNEVDSAYCDSDSKALNALLLTPADNIHDLAIKLRTFNEEEIDEGWSLCRPIVALLADDARRLASQS